MKYSLESLIKSFSRHAKEYEKSKINNPPNDIEDFNLAEALLSMVKEIKLLKDSNENT